MKKRLLSLLLAVILVSSILQVIPALAGDAWDGATTSEPISTDGTYQLSCGAELAWFTEKNKNKFKHQCSSYK